VWHILFGLAECKIQLCEFAFRFVYLYVSCAGTRLCVNYLAESCGYHGSASWQFLFFPPLNLYFRCAILWWHNWFMDLFKFKSAAIGYILLCHVKHTRRKKVLSDMIEFYNLIKPLTPVITFQLDVLFSCSITYTHTHTHTHMDYTRTHTHRHCEVRLKCCRATENHNNDITKPNWLWWFVQSIL